MTSEKMTAEEALWRCVQIDSAKVPRVLARLRTLGFDVLPAAPSGGSLRDVARDARCMLIVAPETGCLRCKAVAWLEQVAEQVTQ